MMCYVTFVAENIPKERVKNLLYVLVASFLYDFCAVFMYYGVPLLPFIV